MDVMLGLCPKAILDQITSYDIFRYYISNFTQVGKFFCSELREDINPTCVVAKYKGELVYKDFKYKGFLNCFEYVKQKYSVNFNVALQIINLDFNLKLISPYKPINRVSLKEPVHYNINIDDIPSIDRSIITVNIRNWEIQDKQFWFDNYKITSSELGIAKIYPLSSFIINDIYYHASNNCYGYYFGKDENGVDLWKIYQPYNKSRYKWRSNVPSDVYQGYDILPEKGELLVITKSWKDILELKKFNIPAISPQSEVCNITDEFMLELKSRFNEIWIIFDNDTTGKKNTSELVEKFNLRYLFMPEESNVKDCSDYVKKYSIESLYQYLILHGLPCNNS